MCKYVLTMEKNVTSIFKMSITFQRKIEHVYQSLLSK